MPLCLAAWRDALRNVNRSPENLLKKKNENDGRYAFPEPGLICSDSNLMRQNQYLTVWDKLRPVIINRMNSGMHQVTLLSNQQWRTILGGRQPSDKTRAGSSRIALNDLLSPESVEAGVDLSLMYELPVRQFSNHEAQQMLWELSELSFRYELVMLDGRAVMECIFKDKSYLKELLSPLTRKTDILRCFPFSPSEPRHLAYVSVDHTSRGLASPAIRDRLPYLTALRLVMSHWGGYEKNHLGWLQVPTQDAPDVELQHYERAIALFYTQTFFHHFGRAAVVPMYLSDM